MSQLTDLLDLTVPLNREERFWTATVLPALAVGSDLSGLGNFVQLLRKESDLPPESHVPTYPKALFLTEFSRLKSAGHYTIGASLTHTDREVTPDVLVITLGATPTIYGIEAKMFDTISSVEWQLSQQKEHCVDPLARDVAAQVGAEVDVRMLALIPEQHLKATRARGIHTITWSDILALGPGTGYYHDLLSLAIESYDKLIDHKARFTEGGMTGERIVEMWSHGTATPPRWVGAGKGPRGKRSSLILDGWKKTEFVVNWSSTDKPSRNWMSLDDFIAETRHQGT
jgi:hypothetical protein